MRPRYAPSGKRVAWRSHATRASQTIFPLLTILCSLVVAGAAQGSAAAVSGGRAVGTVGQLGAAGREIHAVRERASGSFAPAANNEARTRPGWGSRAPGPAELQAGGVAQPRPAPRQSMAPVPLLEVSAPAPMTIRGPAGKPIHFWQVRITNRYHAAATAYAVGYVTRLPLGFSSQGSRWFDAIPGVHLLPPLAPGAQVALTVPWHGGRVPVVRDRCVIYADGAVAGNLSLVGHFMSARAVFLAELPSTIARLQSIAHGSGGSRATTIRYFKHQAELERRVLSTFDPKGRHPSPPARIALSVVATLTVSQRDMEAAAAVLAQTMATWQSQLVASRPRLPQIGFSPRHRGS